MKLKKRKKSRRMEGSRYHGFAAKKHKGKGNKGGKGMSGTGKKAGQKITYVLRYLYPYFGKESLKRKSKKLKEINLRDLGSYFKNAKKTSEGYELDMLEYKILGEGELKEKLIIKASGFSKQAKEKIEKAGGKAVLLGRESKPKEDKKIKEKIKKTLLFTTP